jgi:hypothetical protein
VQIEELPEQPGLAEQLLGGLDARAQLSSMTARLLARWWPLLRGELARRGALGALYCSRFLVM